MSSLSDFISPEATVITPNQRLAQTLVEQWMQKQASHVVAYPKCYPLSNWLRQMYYRICQDIDNQSHPLLIEDDIALRLWQQILADTDYDHHSQALVEKLYQAWCQCQIYHCEINALDFDYNHQTKWFAGLASKFANMLKMNHFIVPAQLPNYLGQYASNIAEQTLIFVCFDHFTPQQELLFSRLTACGIKILKEDIHNEPCPDIGKVTLENSDDEISTWIDWLVEQMKTDKPSIAVILPNLQDCATDIQRLLRYHFSPDIFNISMGQSLLDYPIVSQAMIFLRCQKARLTHHDIRVFLTSPYLKGSQTEWQKRAVLFENNRSLKQMSVSWELWLDRLKPTCPILYNLCDTLPGYPDSAQPSDWATIFYQQLRHFGFPGDYGLSSSLYQCYEKWQATLSQLALFDRVESDLTADKALDLFEQQLKKHIFQPKSASSQIQILGMLEAAGCQFDAIWIAGLTDLTLPATGALSPFIPIPLQKKHGFPYASQEKENYLAQKQLKRLSQSCQSLRVSYARFSEDTPNMPSALIQDMPDVQYAEKKRFNQHSASIQVYQDPELIPLQDDEHIKGGSRILANQAQCPFKAFAAHRLAIQDSEKMVDGLDSRDKGNLIHHILQLVWQQLQNQQTLLSMSDEALANLVDQQIIDSITHLFQNPSSKFELSILELEQKKLQKLILGVLEEEKKRPSFSVTAVEQNCQYDFEQFSVRLKYDRLDTIEEDGSQWMIDYKSTMPSGTPWLDDRPDDTQLLLYALLDENIRTISYFQIQTGSIKHKGFAQHPPPVKGIQAAKKMNWSDYRLRWRSIIEGLAHDFAKGISQPEPKKPSICTNCSFSQLCRYPIQNSNEAE